MRLTCSLSLKLGSLKMFLFFFLAGGNHLFKTVHYKPIFITRLNCDFCSEMGSGHTS